MERLTTRSSGPLPVLVRGKAFGPAYFMSEHDYECYRDALNKLAAYEDTGLEPEEIAEVYRRFSEARAIAEEFGQKYAERADELLQAEAEGRLLVLETAPRDSYKGLKRKYIVFKSDSGEPVENCFVLRPDKDHAAKIALEAYAKTTDNKTLADDITRWIGDSGKVLVPPCKVGDTVYIIIHGKIYEGEVYHISYSDYYGKVTSAVRTKIDFLTASIGAAFEDFGKTAFRAREEAEAALKEVSP